MTLNSLLALLGSVLLISLKDILYRILMTIVGRRLVEYMVLSALRWLAKRTDSNVDDDLVQKLENALQDTPSSVESPIDPKPPEA